MSGTTIGSMIDSSISFWKGLNPLLELRLESKVQSNPSFISWSREIMIDETALRVLDNASVKQSIIIMRAFLITCHCKD